MFFNLIAFAQVEYEEPCGFVREEINLNRAVSSPYSYYISITSTQTVISNNYILDVNTGSVNIDVSTYPSGSINM
ncbi:hypothetical protein [Mesonia phycicola]|uniref:hypothetical protein n=1 Tax=Mesonia phycicola TaxID=579105 RepID=UPI0009327B12|nr:hypothetical protein [Mesonia phycicola]